MQIDTKQLKQLETKLLRLNQVGLKIAVEQTMNDLAFDTRTASKEVINKKFTTRNAFTTSNRNMPVLRANRHSPFSEVGHTQEYMKDQEEGFQKRPDKFTGAVAIPTPVASGERKGMAQGKTIRRKAVRKPNRKNMMKMPSDKMRSIPRRQRTMALIKKAIQTKRRFIEIERNGESSIYRVTGSQKRFQLHRMYTTEHRTIVVKPKKWLQPAVDKTMEGVDATYTKRLKFQVDRLMKK